MFDVSKIKRMPYSRNVQQGAINEIESLREQLKESEKREEKLKLELEKETIRKNEAFMQEDNLLQENKELKRQRFRNYNDEEYIIFFDDGEDYPDSMSAPVVMSAEKFRELFYSREKLNVAKKVIGKLILNIRNIYSAPDPNEGLDFILKNKVIATNEAMDYVDKVKEVLENEL